MHQKHIYSAFILCTTINFQKLTLMTGFVVQGHKSQIHMTDVVTWALLGIINNGIFRSVYILHTIFFKQQKAVCPSKRSGKHEMHVPYSWAPRRPSGPDRSSRVFSSALPTDPPADSETPGSSCCPDAEPSPDRTPPGWKQEVSINICTV